MTVIPTFFSTSPNLFLSHLRRNWQGDSRAIRSLSRLILYNSHKTPLVGMQIRKKFAFGFSNITGFCPDLPCANSSSLLFLPIPQLFLSYSTHSSLFYLLQIFFSFSIYHLVLLKMLCSYRFREISVWGINFSSCTCSSLQLLSSYLLLLA